MVKAHSRDAIRIVPLQIPETAAAPAVTGAQLTYRGGPLLTAVQVFAIFWGEQWSQDQSNLASAIDQFFGFIVSSSLLDQLGEYSVQGMIIGHGSYLGSAIVTNPAPSTTVDDTAIRDFLNQQLSTNSAVPPVTDNSLYFIFLPSGVTVTQSGSASCQDFCGYHDTISGSIFYGVLPYPDCSGCMANLNLQDAETTTISHELCEAITDPVPGQGWYDDANGEIGDICAWQTKQLGAYTVQTEWSNKANACV